MEDERFHSIDAGWLVNAFTALSEEVQAEAIDCALEFTTEHCPSGPVPRNILDFLSQILREADEDKFGVGCEVMRIGGARFVHPEFVRCIESMCGPQPQLWTSPGDQSSGTATAPLLVVPFVLNRYVPNEAT